jgi:soluble lytic murein transglycosylase-like protein
MKFVIPGLILACSTLLYGFTLPDKPLTTPFDLSRSCRVALSNLGFSMPIDRAPSLAPPPEPARRKPIDTHSLIRAAAKKHRVPTAFVKSIVAAESNFNRYAMSSTGAIGLMQLMPATAAQYGADPSIPEQNVDAGTRYLRELMDKYRKHSNSLARVIAAYNAGPGMVDRYRGVPPFPETRSYVARVLSFLRHFQKESE